MKLFTYAMLFLLLTVCSAEEVKMDGAPRGRLLSSKLKNSDDSIMTKRRELEDSRRNLGCKDTDKGLKDSYGDGCEWYDIYPLGCGDYDVSGGFRANAMCCSCGGGAQTEARDVVKKAYWDSGACGPEGDDANWEICDKKNFDCPDSITVDTNVCPNGVAFKTLSEGGVDDITFDGYTDSTGCNYQYYVEYSC